MTVKQLKEALEGLPDHMDVFIDTSYNDSAFALANQAKVKEVTFIDDRLKAKDKCLVLSDE